MQTILSRVNGTVDQIIHLEEFQTKFLVKSIVYLCEQFCAGGPINSATSIYAVNKAIIFKYGTIPYQ